MGAKTIIGYILALIGIVGLVMSLFPDFLSIPLPEFLSKLTITIVSIIIIAIGIFLISKSSTATIRAQEVPIYKGKTIVGYRRH